MNRYKGKSTAASVEQSGRVHVLVEFGNANRSVGEAKRLAQYAACYAGYGRSRKLDGKHISTFCFRTVDGATAFARAMVNVGFPVVVTNDRQP